jgi:hypothetical protein
MPKAKAAPKASRSASKGKEKAPKVVISNNKEDKVVTVTSWSNREIRLPECFKK